MLIQLTKFGGKVPAIHDPAFLPDGKSQAAIDCRFDEYGVTPYLSDTVMQAAVKAGTVSLYRYYNNYDSNEYFFAWTTDVDAVTAPLPNDAYSRVYYTESGLFKVTDKDLFKSGGTQYPMQYRWPCPPAPSTAPVITGTASGTDPTLLETKAYVYIYVNGYGDEGPPSYASNEIDVYDGNSITITNISAGALDPLFNVTTVRIYRLNQTSSGTAIYQYVDEVAFGTTSYVDTILDADLAEELPSLEWDGAPTGLAGLISLPNGVLAGFVGNLVCLSVPYYPHAWPASYQQAVDRPIIALGAFGSTIVVLTEGQPYLLVGNDPSNMVMEKMDIGFSCMSKRGVIQAGEMVAYPSPEGLVVIGPQVREVVTAKIMTRDQWNALYNPSTISAFYWNGKYVAFYTSGGVNGGFVYDFKTGDLFDLDFYATAGFYDKTAGILFLQE